MTAEEARAARHCEDVGYLRGLEIAVQITVVVVADLVGEEVLVEVDRGRERLPSDVRVVFPGRDHPLDGGGIEHHHLD